MKHPQFILAIDTAYLNALGAKDGLNTHIQLADFFAGADGHLVIRRRQELEGNENYLRILPYCLIAKGDIDDLKNLRLSAYYRPVSGGESRLHGNLSVGYGGHVDLADVSFTIKSIVDFSATVKESSDRELEEEVGLYNASSIASNHYGLITDKSNSVGRVHLGIVHIYIVPENWQADAEDSEVDLAGEFTPAELLAKEEAGEIVMESWTKLIVQSMNA